METCPEEGVVKEEKFLHSRKANGEALYSQQKQHWELTVAQIMYSLLPKSDLKKGEKTTRPFRYDLNQIPYDLYNGSEK